MDLGDASCAPDDVPALGRGLAGDALSHGEFGGERWSGPAEGDRFADVGLEREVVGGDLRDDGEERARRRRTELETERPRGHGALERLRARRRAGVE